MSSSLPVAAGTDAREPASPDAGRRRIETAFQSMPVLQAVRKQIIRAQPLAGVRLLVSSAVTPESANLMITLRDGGATVSACPLPSLPVHEEVAAALSRDYMIEVQDVESALAPGDGPHLLVDTAGLLARDPRFQGDAIAEPVIGATEEDPGGAQRLRAAARRGSLPFAVFDLSESWTKSLFDRRLGTAQGMLDLITRSTGILLAGLTFVVAGYGRCGRGLAMRARGLGALVIVTEIDPMRAAEAVMDGYRVMSMGEAASLGDVFCTSTGIRHVIARDHFDKLKNGAILANAGHADVEIDVEALGRLASARRRHRESVEEFTMRDGRRLHVVGGGRSLGQSCSAPVADTNYALQALVLEYIIKNQGSFERSVYGVPEAIDRSIARYKLEVTGIKIDRLNVEQEQYLASWSEGLQ